MKTTERTLSVSREGVIASMRDTFTSHDIFIQELMQNAHRAGATQLDIHYDEELGIISFSDNGKGIGDSEIEALLTLGESDWSDEVTASAHPYGLGFASAVFASTKIMIKSEHLVTLFDTAPVLAGETIYVDHTPTRDKGTKIALALNDGVIETRFHSTKLEKLKSLIDDKAQAFPIPVFFNGWQIHRGAALELQPMTFADGSPRRFETEVGTVVLSETYNSRHIGTPTYHNTVLQGFLVGTRFSANHTVYLDGSQFKARMPDRAHLLNYDSARVGEVIKGCLVKRAKWLADNKSRGELTNQYWRFLATVLPEAVKTLEVPLNQFSIATEFYCKSYDDSAFRDIVTSPNLQDTDVDVNWSRPILNLDDSGTDSKTLLTHYAAMLLRLPAASHTVCCTETPHSDNIWTVGEVEITPSAEGLKRLTVHGMGGDRLNVILCDHFTVTAHLVRETEDGKVEMQIGEAVSDAAIWTEDDEIILPGITSHHEAYSLITYLDDPCLYDDSDNFQDAIHSDLAGKLGDLVRLNRGGSVNLALLDELRDVVRRLKGAGASGEFNVTIDLDSGTVKEVA